MYYHEARRHEQSIRKTMQTHRKNFQQAQERRRRVEAMRDPHHLLLVEGRACKILRQGPQQQQLESSLMPWQGRMDSMIDRFDVRAIMDFLPSSPPSSSSSSSFSDRPSASSSSDADISSHDVRALLNYERYRPLVDALRHALPPSTLLDRVSTEIKQKLVSSPSSYAPSSEGGGSGGPPSLPPSRPPSHPPFKPAGVEGHYGPSDLDILEEKEGGEEGDAQALDRFASLYGIGGRGGGREGGREGEREGERRECPFDYTSLLQLERREREAVRVERVAARDARRGAGAQGSAAARRKAQKEKEKEEKKEARRLKVQEALAEGRMADASRPTTPKAAGMRIHGGDARDHVPLHVPPPLPPPPPPLPPPPPPPPPLLLLSIVVVVGGGQTRQQ
ncbi:clk4-associating serine arginine rich protein [Nannochloropsis oceanica]